MNWGDVIADQPQKCHICGCRGYLAGWTID